MSQSASYLGKSRPRRATMMAAAAVSLAVGFSPVVGSAQSPPPDQADAVYTLRVKTKQPVRTARLLASRGYDLVESRAGSDLLVLGDSATRARLRRDGYRAVIYNEVSAGAQSELFFGGYKTADEYIQTLDNTAAAYPSLAVSYDVGDSWLKTQNAALGNDIKAICITKLQPGDCQLTPASTKPRFFLMGTVHARELTPTEVADRWITELTTKYGVDAEITDLVDNTELWVLPLANPDGREIAEPGTPTPYLQRKNANNSAGGACSVPPTVSNQSGVDINRNHNWSWGGVGTSTDPCAQTYRGTSAASEPETAALQNLMTQLFPDQRGSASTAAAPITATGMMMTMHSYGNLVLFPWGDISSASPNDAGLRAMAFRFNWYNGYTAGQPGQVLYNTSGSTDDWAYGTLGVAASTIEFGPNSGACGGFTPPYSCQSSFFTSNRNMLIYAGKLARQPYALSLGPNTHTASVTPNSVVAGTSVTLGARGQDSASGSSGIGRPASQVVNAAQYYIDVPPWAGGTPVAMTATDGNFNSSSELIRATVPTTGLSTGVHKVYLRSRDANNNWGPVTVVNLTVQ
ncbi:MAG: M14 family zinc carboxypeptidase [Nocardioides sp.]